MYWKYVLWWCCSLLLRVIIPPLQASLVREGGRCLPCLFKNGQDVCLVSADSKTSEKGPESFLSFIKQNTGMKRQRTVAGWFVIGPSRLNYWSEHSGCFKITRCFHFAPLYKPGCKVSSCELTQERIGFRCNIPRQLSKISYKAAFVRLGLNILCLSSRLLPCSLHCYPWLWCWAS